MVKSLTFALLLLAGCASPPPPITWTKQGSTYEEFQKDRAQCTYEVERALATYGSSNQVPASMGSAVAQGLSEGYDRNQRAQRLGTLCMQGRGYVPKQ